jgi:hypothetical protein
MNTGAYNMSHCEENTYETPTAGNSIVMEKSKQKELIGILSEISVKIKIVDGSFSLDVQND